MSLVGNLTVEQDEPARFTAQEFMQLAQMKPVCDWTGKTELIRGIITRLAPAHIPRWNAQRVTHQRLYEALRDVRETWIVGQEPSVRLAGDTVRQPDVALLRDVGEVGELFDRAALFLAIEIADSSRNIDLGAKRLTYAGAFIPHYWVVDSKHRIVRIFSNPSAGDYRDARPVPFGTPIDVPGTDRTIVID